MKRRFFLAGLALLGAAACRDADGTRNPMQGMGGLNYPPEPLSKAEKAGILQLREEEKLARDVYITLGGIWGLNAHLTIQNSEQRHMDSMALLVDRYDLVDPAKSSVGRFTDAHLQELYSSLVSQGEVSEIAALEVGMTIEDLDLYDLDQVLAANDNQDIAQILGNLRHGSEMHLRRFYADLTALGGDYSPQYISQAEFERILGL